MSYLLVGDDPPALPDYTVKVSGFTVSAVAVGGFLAYITLKAFGFKKSATVLSMGLTGYRLAQLYQPKKQEA